ncbi:hypothetical protein ABK040_003680 [Willaertia magna]
MQTKEEEIKKKVDVLLQYILVRKDLLSPPFNWPIGSLISQGCHASVSIISDSILDKDEQTMEYIDKSNPIQMHKVVLECPSEEQLLEVNNKLLEKGMKFKLWIEEPEKIPTALATKPYPKSMIQPFFKKFKLFK